MTTNSAHAVEVGSMPQENLQRLESLRHEGHPQCMACTHAEYRLEFELETPQVLVAHVEFTDEMTSFNHMVHGGLQSFLIDQAMTCALMGLGIYGATCELTLRYRSSVEVGLPAKIRVWVEKRYRTLYDVKAELIQNETVRTFGSARFLKQTLAVS
ncbi:hotdog domain-containing protein [Kiritimatiellota bacterium B12222]|nr:hotdog domain-containing protein [Kiritimatiellota bacterium B12222]